ncbi:MAG: hypothetical protein RJA61_280 [Candidatus Parcubacteria bacterium]|jgi:hemolysin III
MEASKPKPFSPLLFVITIIFSLAPFVYFAWLVAPQSFSASPWTYVLIFICMHLATCFFEHPFHRYILHARVIPGLGNLYTAHTKHHALTTVRIRLEPDSKLGRVCNNYPIVKEEQHESSFFPWWSLLGFSVFASLFFVPLQIVLPEVPILLVGYATIACAMCLYEIAHAIEHWSFETWWKPRINIPGWKGNFWKKIYMFHFRHHLDILCNECISGFFLLPLADWVFGTFKMPNILYQDGTVAHIEEAASPKPIWPIRQLDRFANWKMGRRAKT